ncbi:PTS fructose transporter subunit IIB [Aliivibrio sp. S4TY2]|jgi:PTS system fructose-specific IIB component|uniref:protein-N(pi)-phosphohistidine--D-fructose phosphotransferase n=2 Tax=Aliivibrio TaxID=511678 RepID=A0A5Q4ZUW6_9GAMM|nr:MULTISPECIES: PTS fructose transporter subunit IIB [Aliivibrio]VVV06422.1 PTS system mannose-specific EIIBCA component [Aliivibrio wodanis]KAB2825129.1 PTS fructose transporter subunit IIB [Aliivibrio finisterrensis]MDD9156755.1 PTS fructose transporter subunit IIB [Aliivibrio sp. S4TY2]MDD9160241.1 PTS fructose transporter subunit IIB [Aliivibrio sp. S4TY1]MDD9164466.1 PTS fructose transporter subunit IIB [Aliivibrio sp. S4MY2]
MKIVAVTACPTGIAHTYMAADVLKKAAAKLGVSIKVETQGAMGVEEVLTPVDIVNADLVIIASDIEIENKSRFLGINTKQYSIESILTDVDTILRKHLS